MGRRAGETPMKAQYVSFCQAERDESTFLGGATEKNKKKKGAC